MLEGSLSGPGAISEFIANGYMLFVAAPETQAAMRRALDAGVAFFRDEPAAKLRNRLPLDTGYRPYGQEYSQNKSHPDEIESFTASRRVPNSDTLLVTQPAKHLNAMLLALFDHFEKLAEQITTSVARELAVERPAIDGSFKKWSLLQMNYSRPAFTSAEFINDLHEDGCLLTIMSVVGPGLELKTPTGEFAEVSPSPTRLLVLAGEIISLLTGAKIPPAYHRVRTEASCGERQSLLFFADMDPMLCKPWIRSPYNDGIDIGRRVLQNSQRFGLSEWTLL